MANEITLFALDYSGEKLSEMTFDLEDILVAWVEVYTGDESINVVNRHGDRASLNAYHATACFFDDEYEIIKNGMWVVPEELFMNRKHSDWHMLYS